MRLSLLHALSPCCKRAAIVASTSVSRSAHLVRGCWGKYMLFGARTRPLHDVVARDVKFCSLVIQTHDIGFFGVLGM